MAKRIGREILASLQIELIGFSVFGGPFPGHSFGGGEHGEENYGEHDSGNGRNLFREKVDEAESGKNGRYKPRRQEIQLIQSSRSREHEFSLTRLFISKHEHSEAL